MVRLRKEKIMSSENLLKNKILNFALKYGEVTKDDFKRFNFIKISDSTISRILGNLTKSKLLDKLEGICDKGKWHVIYLITNKGAEACA
jgi:DNA-binding PadR family transcriptional regulator